MAGATTSKPSGTAAALGTLFRAPILRQTKATAPLSALGNALPAPRPVSTLYVGPTAAWRPGKRLP
jgi:hypothetical protein